MIPPHRTWRTLTQAEKFKFYEAMNKALAESARALEEQYDAILKDAGCSMRTRVRMHVLVDPNDDPRLP